MNKNGKWGIFGLLYSYLFIPMLFFVLSNITQHWGFLLEFTASIIGRHILWNYDVSRI